MTVGNYPGIEARIYGSEGALICRLVEEDGVCETLKAATPDAVEFGELEVPERFYPDRAARARVVAIAVLRQPDRELHRRDPGRRRRRTRATSTMARWVQEVINAVELSFRERRWVDLPLPR